MKIAPQYNCNMKLLIRQIKFLRKHDGDDASSVTTEELFDLSVGFVPFSKNSSKFEIVEIQDDEVSLKIKTRIRGGYLIKKVKKDEVQSFIPLTAKDALAYFVYQFELVEVNYEKH